MFSVRDQVEGANNLWHGLHSAVAIVSTVAILAAAGCSSKANPDWKTVYPTTGKLTFNGAVPQGASVVLHPKSGEACADGGSLCPKAQVQSDGTFVLSSYLTNDGAPPGDYVATVEWHKVVKTPSGDPSLGPNLLPAKYSKAETSPVTITIAQGKNDLAPIVLK